MLTLAFVNGDTALRLLPDTIRELSFASGPANRIHDEKGGSTGHFDVHDYIQMCRDEWATGR